MKAIYIGLIILLLISTVVYAEQNVNLQNISFDALKQPRVFAISDQCNEEFKSFMGQEPKDLVLTYCSQTQKRGVWALVAAFIIFLFEARFKKWLYFGKLTKQWWGDKPYRETLQAQLLKSYLAIGLGLIFIGILVIMQI